MINAQQLRIGNLVKDDTGRIGKVLSIAEKSIRLKMEHSTLKIDTGHAHEGVDVEPIELSPSLLEQFGFEKSHSIFWVIDKGVYTFLIKLYDDGGFRFTVQLDDDPPMTIGIYKYLHTLQNLIFNTSGQELEIQNL